jgi:L-ascorbate metabolism protein UlaG (beta-lactamase superfamily)
MNFRTILLLALSIFIMNYSFTKPIETDSFTAKDGKQITVHFIQHASLYFAYSGMTIYVDPVNYENVDYKKMPKADVILITHDHYDHLDKNAVTDISTLNTKIFCNSTVFKALGKGIELENGQEIPFKLSMFNNAMTIAINIEAVPAYNTTEGRDKFHPKGRDNGYILTLGETRIYIPGDCEEMPEMAEFKDIDVAFLPINQPYTMTVEQAINAAQTIKPKILYPIHYSDTELGGLSALKDAGIDVRVF